MFSKNREAKKMYCFPLPPMGLQRRKKTRGCALDSTKHRGAHRDGKKAAQSSRFFLYNNRGWW